MRKIIFLLTIISLMTSGCVTGPKGYMKKSANNKLFDTKGFQGGKRIPLYNKQYIAKAKRNVASGKYDDDESWDDIEYEDEDISLANREIYRQMIRDDLELANKKKSKWSFFNRDKTESKYPVTAQTGYIMNHKAANTEIKRELEELKAMLYQTQREFASYRCPVKDNSGIKSDESPVVGRGIDVDSTTGGGISSELTRSDGIAEHVHSI